jgi:hypothetical protein
LKGNHPNPFNPTTTIEFTLDRTNHVSLKVYNLLGQEVETLVDDMLEPGAHHAVWDAGNLPSGTYFYRLETENDAEIRQMTLLK